jgi:hypothetical protein
MYYSQIRKPLLEQGRSSQHRERLMKVKRLPILAAAAALLAGVS